MSGIKSMERISAKWARNAAAGTPSYQEGIENPRRDWAEETAKAEPAYDAGIQKSIANKSFGKGVKRAGTSKWQNNSLTKGVSRWAAGIADSQTAYAEGFAPYAAVIARTPLPPRGPKGDPKNIERVRVMAKALNDEKTKRA